MVSNECSAVRGPILPAQQAEGNETLGERMSHEEPLPFSLGTSSAARVMD